MQEDEMTYVEGGGTLTRGVFVGTVSVAVGIAVGALTAGIGAILATAALRIVLASYTLRYALAAAIVKAIGAFGIAVGNQAANICGAIAGLGASSIAGLVFDRWIDGKDGRMDGRLVW
jgi:hypothetical protein